MYYRPGAPLAFDLRGRFLYTRQYGLDALRDFNIDKNLILNGTSLLDYTTYPVDLQEPRGFVYQNHQTTTAELGLEGLITLNQLRERTGVHVGLFGGIGLDWFKATTDQADANGNEYFEGYANINETRSNTSIRNELQRLLDGDYETVADGNEDNGSLKFMPSLGLELGLQLSKNFLIYGGHRVTFSGTDALDGQRFADPNNDLYHYTNLGLRWTINPAKEEPIARLPEIEILSPLGSPYTTNSGNGLVVANIRNINSPADVDCIVNNRSVPFNYRNGRFSIDTPLNPGSNEVTIIAGNEHGQDRETVILVYRDEIVNEPRVEAPRVRFTNPSSSSYRTEESDHGIRASIENVNERRDITFTVNGVDRDFIFENGILRSNIALREGDNHVQIRARNTAGTDVAEVRIIREVRIPLPIVDIIEPTGNRVESRFNTARVTAQVHNVEDKSDITWTQNGRTVWSFDYDAIKGYAIADINLDNGANTLIVTARNRAGEARDEVVIIYQEPLPEPKYPPTVSITEPNRSNTSTTQASARIEATITNVSNRNDIGFTVSGTRRTDFTFDTRSGRLSANVNLVFGNNDIVIRAINRDGEDQQSVAIRRIEDVIIVPKPPTVRINAPANNSETENISTELRASIEHIDNKNQIEVLVNGRNTYDFNFNRGQLTANANLIEGNNTIRVKAMNRDGSDEASVNIRYRKVQLPFVKITTPGNNSETSNTAASIRASVENVNSKNQINLVINGRSTSSFSFDQNRREITANVNLSEGNNTIRVEAQNSTGNASDQINVRYRRAMPPTVSISAPANNSISESTNVNLHARLTNVNNRNEVTVQVNGNLVTNFSLNGNDLSANIALREGNNSITVRVSNADGSDEASVNIRYQPIQKPIVTIVDPASSSFNVSQNNYVVRASVKNVDSKNNVTVQVNGSNYSVFNFDPKTGEVVIRVINLIEGDNSVLVRGSNQGGSAEAKVTLRYYVSKPPTVSITEPANGSTTESNKASVKAIITNMSSKRSISFKVNGKSIPDFELNGENFSSLVDLQAGVNTITIAAQNEDGRAEASTKVTFTLKNVQLLAPSVRFVQPSKSGIVVKERSYNIEASTINVSSRNELIMWVNDKEWTEFNYDGRSKKLSSVLNLQPGKNTVRIKAENKGGSDETETFIIFEAGAGPIITIESISQPTVNPLRPQVGNSTIIAKLENVSGKENVKVLVNDKEFDDFSFDSSSKQLQATIQLKRGKNTVVIQASNESGTVEETRTIEF
ncbi:MAG: hypothetical protein IPJ74_04035 [Saprospiraceae bacterium]|nr:hypothetical protein [Saprospiraceae bacterium]